MGDYTITHTTCPVCGADIEEVDQPSSMLWSCHCDKCGYDDGLDYYETGRNEISLMTKKQYKEWKKINKKDKNK